jgi:GNAT superfamily N-acetyltransferase
MEIDPQTPEFTTAIEDIEAQAWETLTGTRAIQLLCEELGPAYGSAVFSHAPYSLANRIVRLGLARPARVDYLDRMIEKYDAEGTPMICVPLAPTARPSTLPRLLKERGFKPAIKEAKFYRNTVDAPAKDPHIRIVTAPEEDYEKILSLYRDSGMDHDWAEVATAHLSSPSWNHYLALEGSKPVAIAGMFVSDGLCWCTPGWTLPDYRARGHQRALLAHRIAAAIEFGCAWVSVNLDVTDEPMGFTVRSYTRQGFKLLYVRTTHIRTRDGIALPDPFERRLMMPPHNET